MMIQIHIFSIMHRVYVSTTHFNINAYNRPVHTVFWNCHQLRLFYCILFYCQLFPFSKNIYIYVVNVVTEYCMCVCLVIVLYNRIHAIEKHTNKCMFTYKRDIDFNSPKKVWTIIFYSFWRTYCVNILFFMCCKIKKF